MLDTALARALSRALLALRITLGLFLPPAHRPPDCGQRVEATRHALPVADLQG